MQIIQNMKYSKHQSEDSDDCFELFGKFNKSSDTFDIGVNSEVKYHICYVAYSLRKFNWSLFTVYKHTHQHSQILN